MPDPIESFEFLRDCVVTRDGFVSLRDDCRWRLGCVIFIQSGQRFVSLTKAVASGGFYEFAGLRSLPGGMIRMQHGSASIVGDIPALLTASMSVRILLETSLALHSAVTLRPTGLGPVVTSYFANGKRRHTLVVAARCELPTEVSVASNDRSVMDAGWSDKPDLAGFAPANRLLLSHLLWSMYGEEEKVAAVTSIEAAVQQCSAWAAEAGLPRAVPPWVDAEDLSIWSKSWPIG